MKLKKAFPILSIASLFLSTGCIDPSKVKDKEKIVKVMAKNISKKFKSVPQITIEKFRQIPSEEIVLVDVRPKVEREVSIIPNAISVEEFEKNSNQYKEKKVVAYCTIGFRSSEWIKQLNEKGFKGYNLEESILGWANRHLKLVDNKGETKRVHVYEEAWNFLPQGYEGIYND